MKLNSLKKLKFILIILLVSTLTSCINFPVISCLTKAESIKENETEVKVGNYARNFSLSLRKGLFHNNFLGSEIGICAIYPLPDANLKGLSLTTDGKISFFENQKTKIAAGIGLNFSYYSKLTNNYETSFYSFYLILPLYLDSSLTDWFRFVLNFRIFKNLTFNTTTDQNFANYKNLIITVNTGVTFFNLISVEGYIVTGEKLQGFPIPGFEIEYKFKF